MINKSFFLQIFFIGLLIIPGYGQDSLSFLALGDSYTIGESVSKTARWPVQLHDSLVAKGYAVQMPHIIARTGWRTDELKAAINQQDVADNYDLVGLLIGVNNQYQGKTPASYEPEFKELLDMAITHAGGDRSRVFVISIPDYGYTPFGEKNQSKISRELDAYNAINQRITEMEGVKYYYITDISRQQISGLVAKDGLHPSGKQYSLWIEHILKDLNFLNSLD